MTEPLIADSGFREYDVRWQYPEQVNEAGFEQVGRALGTQLAETGKPMQMAVGHDLRSYSPLLHGALIRGLVWAGVEVYDVGMALSPMAYFAQFHLGIGAVAMVTASHNPNGWTGVKMGFNPPLTHGPEEMARLKEIVVGGLARPQSGGRVLDCPEVAQAYIDDLSAGAPLTHPLKVVCATGNGTASAFAPEVLRRIGAQVVELHCALDDTFPHYNPNPEAHEMLSDMARALRESGADIALGFDGDGDRCGIIDDAGDEVYSDKLGLILMRDLAPRHPGTKVVVDIKSTGLFAKDPVLAEHGVTTDYWMTGHSHMKRRVQALGAIAGFEKSGHFYLAPPLGLGYDCGLRAAVEVCRMLDRNPTSPLSQLSRDLGPCFTSPTMSPFCPDEEKYQVVERFTQKVQKLHAEGGEIAGRSITGLNTVNGVRISLDNGSWGLVRASSNTPNLVVVTESPNSADEMRDIFEVLDAMLSQEPSVGAYDQRL